MGQIKIHLANKEENQTEIATLDFGALCFFVPKGENVRKLPPLCAFGPKITAGQMTYIRTKVHLQEGWDGLWMCAKSIQARFPLMKW